MNINTAVVTRFNMALNTSASVLLQEAIEKHTQALQSVATCQSNLDAHTTVGDSEYQKLLHCFMFSEGTAVKSSMAVFEAAYQVHSEAQNTVSESTSRWYDDSTCYTRAQIKQVRADIQFSKYQLSPTTPTHIVSKEYALECSTKTRNLHIEKAKESLRVVLEAQANIYKVRR